MEQPWMLPEHYRSTFVMSFEDPTFNGFKCVMKRHTARGVAAAFKAVPIPAIDIKEGKISKKKWKIIDDALVEFSRHLVSWNLLDENGRPIPASEAGVRSTDLIFVLQIFMIWLNLFVQSAAQGADILETSIVDTDSIPMDEIEVNNSGE